MTTPPVVLDLLQEIARGPKADMPGRPEVLLALVDDLGDSRAMLETAIRTLGGQFVSAHDVTLGVQGPLSPDLKRVCQLTLSLTRVRGLDRLELKRARGVVRATLRGLAANAGLSDGEQVLLGVATSLFSEALQQSALAVIHYKETDLDELAVAGVWDLFTNQLAGVTIGALETLVVLIESPTSSSVHSGRLRRPVVRLGSSGLERRKTWTTDQQAITRLGRSDGPLILFLGAGFSYSSRLPLGDELRDRALRVCLPAVDAAAPFSTFAETLRLELRDNDRMLEGEERLGAIDFARGLTLERVLREEFHRDTVERSQTIADLDRDSRMALATPGRAVRALHRLIAQRSSLVIVTVNFDQLIESAGNVRVITSTRDFSRFPRYFEQYRRTGGDVPLLKLHGTIDKPETIVATVDDIGRGLDSAKVRALEALVAGRRTVRQLAYVGYSMRDRDVTGVLSLRRFSDGLEESWASPYPIPTALEFASSYRTWSRRGFMERSITQTADTFVEELALARGA